MEICKTPSLEEVLKIKASREKEELRVRTCILLDICPVCGAKIINLAEKELYYEYKDNNPSFWNKLFNSTRYEDYRICPIDKNHFLSKREYTTGDIY